MKMEAAARAMHQNLIDFQTPSKVTYIKSNLKRDKILTITVRGQGHPDPVDDINLDQVVL